MGSRWGQGGVKVGSRWDQGGVNLHRLTLAPSLPPLVALPSASFVWGQKLDI